MATIWFDDFSSGNPLSTSYSDIWESETNATCGRSGGWGCRGVPGDDEEWGEFYYTLPVPVEREYFRITFDVNSSAVTEGGELLALADGGHGAYLQLARESWVDELGAPWNHLTVKSFYSSPDPVIAETATEVITPGTWQTIVLEVWFSTYGGYHLPPNADGRVQVTVDGVVVINATNCRVHTSEAYDGNPNGLGRVYLVPAGSGDNFGIYDAPADDAQYARPIADLDAGAWTPSSGVTLYPMVNDVTPDDGTFIRSPDNPVDAACELALNDVEPFVDGDVTITIRGMFDPD